MIDYKMLAIGIVASNVFGAVSLLLGAAVAEKITVSDLFAGLVIACNTTLAVHVIQS